MLKKFFALLVIMLMSSSAFAVSFSLLKGDNFRDDLGYRPNKTTLTIENFAVWEYGTVFFYYDITDPFRQDGQQTVDNGATYNINNEKYFSNQFFGGISPTFSLSKMTGADVSWKFIRDVSLRFEVENGSGNGRFNFQNYFYGLQYDLAIPGFDFFALNTVIRDNPTNPGYGFQIGMFWQMSWEFNRYNRYKFTGFLATSPWNGDQNSDKAPWLSKNGRYLTTQPQFLYDLGYALWGKQNRMEVGVEYAYFINRFQQKDKDEKCAQAMIKFSL